MTRFFHKRYSPPGTPPGSLRPASLTALAETPPLIHSLHYRAEDVQDLGDMPLDRLPSAEEGVLWIDVQGSAQSDWLEHLGQRFGLHRLALEDVANAGQRPKADFFPGHLFVTLQIPRRDEQGVHLEQLSLFLLPGVVVSLFEGQRALFDPIRWRLRENGLNLRKHGADYLLYTLIDLAVDEAFPVLEDYGEELERLEERLLDEPRRAALETIHSLKHELLIMRRQLWPAREVINRLLRDADGLICAEVMPYLKDIYDHTVHVMDLLETYRDITASMLDLYLSSVNNRMNDIMRVLTIISTLFIPLTFVTGLYGMNFGNNTASPWAMPELRLYYGYPLVLLLMVSVAIGMLLFFRRKRWL